MPLTPISRKVLLAHGKRREIANRLGVSESYVSQIVNGVKLPSGPMGRKVAVAVSRALGMKVNEVFAEPAPQHVLHRSLDEIPRSV